MAAKQPWSAIEHTPHFRGHRFGKCLNDMVYDCVLGCHLPGWTPIADGRIEEYQSLAGAEASKRMSLKRLEDRTKAYFQCVLSLGDLFGKGLVRFSHREPVAYYNLLLRASELQDIQPGQGAKEYNRRLKGFPAIEDEGVEAAPALMDADDAIAVEGAVFSDSGGEDALGALVDKPPARHVRRNKMTCIGSRCSVSEGFGTLGDGMNSKVRVRFGSKPQVAVWSLDSG